jgi:hypothetical protein
MVFFLILLSILIFEFETQKLWICILAVVLLTQPGSKVNMKKSWVVFSGAGASNITKKLLISQPNP